MIVKKTTLSLLLALMLPLFFSQVYAMQSDPVKNVGTVKSVNIAGQQVKIETDNAFVELTAYSASIIRVRIGQTQFVRDFSYAVTAKPTTTKMVIKQTADEVTMTTDALKVRIAKHPFSVSFETLDGKIINQDETGLTTSWIGDDVTTYKKMQDGERFIGLGEKTGNLDRRGNAYTNWNSDTPAYAANADPLYATIPFYVGIHHDLNYGIFFDNSYQSDFNFGASNNRFSSFGAHGGEMNYYFICHPRVADIISSYTALTGRMPMPPLWSLGYQQNRWSYYPETEVMRIAQTLREKKIPADGITLDVHYMDGYKLFTWDKTRFPDPAGMTAKLRAMGFKTTVIVDPGVKVEKGYGVYERGMKEDIFIKYPDGSNYTGEVWPGWCNFPDFTSDKGREWWRKEVKTYAAAGVSGVWNDMNEIATWGAHMPNNVLFDFDGAPTTHKQAHNVFALGMARSSYEGMVAATNMRPFILTRAGYSGLQRYSAIWTGDNRSEEDHMLLGVRLLNSLGVSGIAFTGMDVGGFLGAPTQSLYARWMQIGAFTPYFRNHASVFSRSAEPWTFGDDVLEISRNYVNLRYTLLPYLYSAFHQAAANGDPVMHTLAIDYTHDAKVYDTQFQNQYLFGPALLVAPFESTKEFGKVYFPDGKWYGLYDDVVETGKQEKIVELSLQKLPAYVKESSIIPLQSLVQSTAEKPSDTLAIHIYKGDVANSYVYYEDDGESFSYQKGAFYQRNIAYDPVAKTITFGTVEGSYKSKFSKLEIVLHGFGEAPAVRINQAALTLESRKFSYFGAAAKAADQSKVSSAVVKNDAAKFVISY